MGFFIRHGPGFHGDLLCDHEGTVEADAELTDDVNVGVVLVLHLREEIQGSAPGDCTEVGFHFLVGHTDAVVFNDEGAGVRIPFDPDFKIAPVDVVVRIRQRFIVALVQCVRCVGDQFPQEDLLVRIDGIDHETQQSLRFRFELFLCHKASFSTHAIQLLNHSTE